MLVLLGSGRQFAGVQISLSAQIRAVLLWQPATCSGNPEDQISLGSCWENALAGRELLACMFQHTK